MKNPLDRLADGFPHGTLDGERAGCVEIGGRYRSDARFKKFYQLGYRGQDLLDACHEGPGEAEIVEQLEKLDMPDGATDRQSPNHPTMAAPAPRIMRLWVLLDPDDQIVMGSSSKEKVQAELEKWSER